MGRRPNQTENNEIHTTAERLLDQWSSGNWACECEPDVGIVCFNCDVAHALCDVTQAYLAEHEADDDEIVTDEWLQSVGFTDDENTNLSLGPMELFLFSGGNELLIDHSSGEYELKTRGDVRRLCRALGIITEEQNGEATETDSE